MARNEGLGAFFKGLVPKVCLLREIPQSPDPSSNILTQLLMTGPKLVFSFWLAQTLIPAFDGMIAGK